MLSDGFIFLAGLFTSLLCAAFLVGSFLELRRLGRGAEHPGNHRR